MKNLLNYIKIPKTINSHTGHLNRLSCEHDSAAVLVKIATQLQQASDAGHYVLPKTKDELTQMMLEKRLFVLLGKDDTGKIHFLASCGYTLIGYECQKPVIELGTLIRNCQVTTNPVSSRTNKTLVHAFDSVSPNKTLGQEVIGLALNAIYNKYPSAVIVATARSVKSQQALSKSGFVTKNWTSEFRSLSCDPSCKGVINNKNCQFADLSFNTISSSSGCNLMIHSK